MINTRNYLSRSGTRVRLRIPRLAKSADPDEMPRIHERSSRLNNREALRNCRHKSASSVSSIGVKPPRRLVSLHLHSAYQSATALRAGDAAQNTRKRVILREHRGNHALKG